MPTNTSAEDDVLHSPRPSQNESLYCTSDDDDAATLDITAFSNDGFSDFKLDLTCLVSPPPSPPQPASPQLHPVSSISSSAARRSVSFSSPAPIGSIVRPASAPRLGLGFGSTTAMGAPPGTNSSSSPRLSFTLPMTANCSRLGRGTPIDPGRRSEWAGHGGVDLGAREDGVLFSTVRSSSGSFLFDGSGGGDARSESPLTEWNYVSPVPVRAASLQLLQPLPKICLAGIDDTEGGSASASLSEWVSSTQKMFASPSTVSLPPVSPMTTQYESARESVEDVSSQHQHQPQEQEQEPQPQPDLLGMSLVSQSPTERELGMEPLSTTSPFFAVNLLSPGDSVTALGTTTADSVSMSVYSCDAEPVPGAQPSEQQEHDLTMIMSSTSGGSSGGASASRARRPFSSLHQPYIWWRRLVHRLKTVLQKRRHIGLDAV
ncbi:unnamed protein product [Mycena citricolor]|uniref:Uncharacterized protein n=1 Tax=Mycena citricolor TaxID=2018698 RepID=A0AAD2K063_9AGAR|nr:unnamed protein product [Mycena citricolor]